MSKPIRWRIDQSGEPRATVEGVRLGLVYSPGHHRTTIYTVDREPFANVTFDGTDGRHATAAAYALVDLVATLQGLK